MEAKRLDDYYFYTQKDIIYPVVANIDSTSIDEEINIEETKDEMTVCNTLSVVVKPREKSPDLAKMFYWGYVAHGLQWYPEGKNCYWVLRMPEEFMDFSGGKSVSMAPWAVLIDDEEADPKSWRGVYNIDLRSKIIFSEEIEINTSQIKKWRPQNVISDRFLNQIEDD